MTVAVVTVAVGETYRAFLPRWLAAVGALERRPEHIIIITDKPADVAAIQHRETLYVRKPTGSFRNHAQVLSNEGIALTNAEWICRMDVDDVIYPHALNELDNTRADVYCFGISVNGDRLLPAQTVTARRVLAAQDNLLTAGSPYRRWVWEQSTGYQDIIYDDWRFWREAAANGARFHASGSIDYYYTLSTHNATNGVNHMDEKRNVFTDVH